MGGGGGDAGGGTAGGSGGKVGDKGGANAERTKHAMSPHSIAYVICS